MRTTNPTETINKTIIHHPFSADTSDNISIMGYNAANDTEEYTF